MARTETLSASSANLPFAVTEMKAQPLARIRPLEAADVRLKLALRDFDQAQTFEDAQRARAELEVLGSQVLSAILVELSSVQPPDRFDVLVESLLNAASPYELVEEALARGAPVDLRASIATALGYAISRDKVERVARVRVVGALRELLRDKSASVRVAAAEAIGQAGLTEAVEDIRAATTDPNAAVVREARNALDSLR